MTIPQPALPDRFVDWYRSTFVHTRMIYGHWSEGPYSRAVGCYHRQVAVLKPTELDPMLDQYLEMRKRRIGGAISSLWHQIEEAKKTVELQVFESAPYDRDMADHTPGRESGSVALALMCARGARPNDIGQHAPLPAQLTAMVALIAEACESLRTPVERFMTHSEAADNLDFPRMDDPAAPTAPYGFRTTCEAWDLEAWIEPETLVLAAPLQAPRPGWMRLGDWLRVQALQRLHEQTRPEWDLPGNGPSSGVSE